MKIETATDGNVVLRLVGRIESMYSTSCSGSRRYGCRSFSI